MSRYFTSDWHLNSTLINKYAKRPFSSAKEAAEKLVANANKTCDRQDMLIHAGDFILTSIDRHDKDEDIPLDISCKTHLMRISCRMFLLAGNHDTGHNVEADANDMMLDLNHKWKRVYVNHFPSDNPNYDGPLGDASWKKIMINLCGHVHDSWLVYYDAKNHVLNYNVSVDVHGYKPVKDSEITQDLDFLLIEYMKVINDLSIDKSFKSTRKDLNAMKGKVAMKLEVTRKKRKAERYEKNGLTKEECLRRKLVAMRAKGVVR